MLVTASVFTFRLLCEGCVSRRINISKSGNSFMTGSGCYRGRESERARETEREEKKQRFHRAYCERTTSMLLLMFSFMCLSTKAPRIAGEGVETARGRGEGKKTRQHAK